MTITINKSTGEPLIHRPHMHLQHNLRELMLKIAVAEAISFDFFDTLFVRSLLDPEDAFDILGKRFGIANFRRLRCAAQASAFRRMRECGRREITLEDIYACFEHSAVSAKELMLAEYELELALVHPNPELIGLFTTVVASGKQVILTSDMYLPAEFFKEAFRQHDLPVVPMFISADRNATKRDYGELFDVVATELGLAHGQILHVGDNALSDIKQAKAKGLMTYHYTELRRPPRLHHLAPECSLARGLLRRHADQIQPNTAEELGFLYGGPAVVAFLDWIAEQAQHDEIDHILFLSRDGYSLDHVAKADAGIKLPKFGYFLGSRIVFTLAAMTDANFHEFIPFLLSGAEGLSIHELLERIGVSPPASEVTVRFGLGADTVITHALLERLEEFLYAYRWEILKVCRRNRRALFIYLKKLGIKSGDRVALVDVGWSGTTQDAFELAIRNLIDIDVHGYYFCLADTRKRIERQRSRKMSALISSLSTSTEMVANIYRNRAVIELFFSAPHESVIGLSVSRAGDVEAVQDHAIDDSRTLSQISSGILAGIERFASGFQRLRTQIGLPVSPLDLAMPLVEFVTSSEWKRHEIIGSAKNFDNWSRTRNRDIKISEY